MKHVYASAVVLVDNATKDILIAQRTEGQIYAGYWEFPGGKIENGETPEDTAIRELEEEVGITLNNLHPLTFIYEKRERPSPELAPANVVVTVCVFIANVNRADVHPKENQPIEWVHADTLADYQLLPANYSLIPHIRRWLESNF